MPFRFIRTGDKPTEQKIYANDGSSSTTILRNCFAPCRPEVKQALDRWIESGQESIQFDFGDHTVEVQKLG